MYYRYTHVYLFKYVYSYLFTYLFMCVQTVCKCVWKLGTLYENPLRPKTKNGTTKILGGIESLASFCLVSLAFLLLFGSNSLEREAVGWDLK